MEIAEDHMQAVGLPYTDSEGSVAQSFQKAPGCSSNPLKPA